MADSYFAFYEEIFTQQFNDINKRLIDIHRENNLVNHEDINQERFEWYNKIHTKPGFYAARMWEFPFAILAANLKEGMKVADVGCGNTPFTAYLAEKVGAKNVTGFDPDFIVDEEVISHSHFGAKKTYIDKIGINFFPESITKMSAADGYFDTVFCISVLEHIDNAEVKEQGIKEMVRMLKPGGKLILTFDLGINNPLNNIFSIIQYSGLSPYGAINFKFPIRRFVNYGNESNVDVFGLVLEKNDELIFLNHSEKKQIPQYQAYKRYSDLASFYNVRYNSILAARDLDTKLGPLKVFIKALLGKYKG